MLLEKLYFVGSLVCEVPWGDVRCFVDKTQHFTKRKGRKDEETSIL